MRRIFCIVTVMIICFLMTGCEKEEEAEFQEISVEELDEEGTSLEDQGSENEKEEAENICVHVCGSVNHPGVYELAKGSRIYEALEAAGGLMEESAADSINQAEILCDGQQIYVPSKEELKNQQAKTGVQDDGKVNLNFASKEELMTLPGIGEAKADAIIRHRNEQGNFKSIEEIMEIEGIKEGVFRKIEDQITVS